MGGRWTIEDEIFELKFSSKQLFRESQKCIAEQKKEKNRAKRALLSGDRIVARLHAENAIRHMNQRLMFLRMSSRLQAIAQRLQAAQNMQTLTKSMVSVVRLMAKHAKSMDLDKLTKTTQDFEAAFEDLDVRSKVMDDSIQLSASGLAPEDAIDDLLRQVIDEHRLEVQGQLADVPSRKPHSVLSLEELKLEEED